MSFSKNTDTEFIKRCFKLAKRGAGKVSPNPLVGAVLVKSGKILSEGWHKKYGDSHAEVNAIEDAKVSIAGATLYCNMEPCCHKNKQTPPCVPLIIEKKIQRVVISNFDPNENVDGKGVQLLKKSGIRVNTSVLENEGREINKFYFKYAKEKIPYITIKIAQSIDGKISLTGKNQTWLTGEKSIRYVHKLRAEYDAVLVGANTIKADDPQLTVRKNKGSNPVRIIIDGKLSIPLTSKIIYAKDPQNTWIFTSENSSQRKIKALSDMGIKIYSIKTSKDNRLELMTVIKILARQKITSLLVEGGADIFSQFLKKDLLDELIVIQTPKILGSGISSQNIKKMKKFNLLSTSRLGNDIRLIFGKNLAN